MFDAWDLKDAVTLFDGPHPLPFVFERRPTIQNLHELKVTVMDVPLLHLVARFVAVRANDMSDIIPVCGVFDA